MCSSGQIDALPTVPSPRGLPSRLSVRRSEGEQGTSIALAGELDLDSTPLLHDIIGASLRSGVRAITLDLSALTFCDVSGLNAILAAAGSAAAVAARLRLENVPPMLTRLCTLAGTLGVLQPADGPAHRGGALAPGCPGDLGAR